MTSSTSEIRIRAYIAAVAARLADLPEEERRDLIEDLEQHLHEVAAEDEGKLIERLGTPEAYADELRASAGLPERRRSIHRRIEDVTQFAFVENVLRFLPELRPGWWILRAFIVAGAGVRLWTGLGHEQGYLWLGLGEIHALAIGGAAALILCVPSVMLGRAAGRDRLVRWISIVGNIATVLVGVMLFGNSYPAGAAPFDSYDSSAQLEYLHHEDGTPIANICAYTAGLELLENVLLFDQDGRPIVNPSSVYDGTANPRDQGFANVYPRDQVLDIGAGATRTFACPTLDEIAGRDNRSPADSESGQAGSQGELSVRDD